MKDREDRLGHHGDDFDESKDEDNKKQSPSMHSRHTTPEEGQLPMEEPKSRQPSVYLDHKRNSEDSSKPERETGRHHSSELEERDRMSETPSPSSRSHRSSRRHNEYLESRESGSRRHHKKRHGSQSPETERERKSKKRSREKRHRHYYDKCGEESKKDSPFTHSRMATPEEGQLSNEEVRSRQSSDRLDHRTNSEHSSKDDHREEIHLHDSSELEDKDKISAPPSPIDNTTGNESPISMVPYYPAIEGCRSVDEFSCLNRIEEGTYGVVYRAECKKTHEIVALKRLKMEKEKEGFPITSLREINTLMKAPHENIVRVKEIVVGSNMDKIFIVMEYVEHDLKSLMETMKKPFLLGEVKTLLVQLLSAIAHLHDNWILHRDLKTSNLLLSHKGILKVGDFGLAREYGSPVKAYTPIVVTLWYRAPELLLECPKYSTPIDVWSIGCIFGEFLTMKPFFPGKTEQDQLNLVFKDLGTPNDKVWPGYSELPVVKKVNFINQPYNTLAQRLGNKINKTGLDLMMRLLAYCPERRLSAAAALDHCFFTESPLPIDPSVFPTWPAKSEGSTRPKIQSPKAPVGGGFANRVAGDNDDILMEGYVGPGFSLRF
jgi:cell division cycle 2-like protein